MDLKIPVLSLTGLSLVVPSSTVQVFWRVISRLKCIGEYFHVENDAPGYELRPVSLN